MSKRYWLVLLTWLVIVMFFGAGAGVLFYPDSAMAGMAMGGVGFTLGATAGVGIMEAKARS